MIDGMKRVENRRSLMVGRRIGSRMRQHKTDTGGGGKGPLEAPVLWDGPRVFGGQKATGWGEISRGGGEERRRGDA